MSPAVASRRFTSLWYTSLEMSSVFTQFIPDIPYNRHIPMVCVVHSSWLHLPLW
jgi:hypothetical protein